MIQRPDAYKVICNCTQHGKKRLGVFTVFMSLAVCMSYSAQAKNVALLVGINDYNQTKPLQGPVNDVTQLKNILQKNWQFAKDDIHILLNEKATHENINKALEALEKRSRAGDHVFLYFSGHGTSMYSAKSTDWSRLLPPDTGAFIPYDAKLDLLHTQGSQKLIKENLITGHWHIKPVLKRLEKDRNVTAIMDACFSENSFRQPELADQITYVSNPRFAAPVQVKLTEKTKDTTENPEDFTSQHTQTLSPYPYQNVMSISASSKLETAEDITQGQLDSLPNLTFDSKPHGRFTDALLRVLSGKAGAAYSQDGQLTYGELEKAIAEIMPTYTGIKPQTPKFQPAENKPTFLALYDKPLFGVTKLARSPSILKNKVRLNVIDNAVTLAQLGGAAKLSSHGLTDYRLLKNNSANAYSLLTGSNKVILANASFNDVIERLNAANWLNNTAYQSKSNHPIRVSARPLENANSFSAGEKVQLAVTMSKDQHLLAFNVTAKGYVQLIFPHPSHPEHRQKYRAGETVLFPKFDISAPFGLDHIVAVGVNDSYNLSNLTNLYNQGQKTGETKNNDMNYLSALLQKKATTFGSLRLHTYASLDTKPIETANAVNSE